MAKNLEDRVHDLESFVRFLKPITAVTLVSIIALVIYSAQKYVGLMAFYHDFNDRQEEVKSLSEQLNGPGGLKSQIQAAQANIDTLQQAINNFHSQFQSIEINRSEKLLIARIESFQASSSPQRYEWSDYTRDLETLNNFAVEYAALWSTLDKQVSDDINNKLQHAADIVQQRAATIVGDSSDNRPKHVVALTNYQNILVKLNRGDGQGTSGEKIMCYESAFPVWLGMVGLYGKPINATSAKCHAVIGL